MNNNEIKVGGKTVLPPQNPTKLPSSHNGKNIEKECGGKKVYRYPVSTKVFLKGDDISKIVSDFAIPFLPLVQQKNIYIALSEKAVAAAQGRAYFIKDLNPSWFATFLVRFVHKSKHGIGLGSPYTMQIALMEVGYPRIILAAVAAALTKPFGVKGVFYHVAGQKARSIDGPADYVIPPYNQAAVLGASNPNKLCEHISKENNIGVMIMDANDIGRNVIGTHNIPEDAVQIIRCAFKDNPLGSTTEQTPICILAWD